MSPVVPSRVPENAKPRRVATRPIEGQRAGTSGLRKKAAVFAVPGYLENFLQSALDVLPRVIGATVVLGGDGRYGNARAIDIILRMLAAAGVARVVVGAGGLLSTPAASGLIRARGADFGIVLSASHNPGGPDGDFGIKINGANGAPAPEALTEAIHARTKTIDRYVTLDGPAVDVARPGLLCLGSSAVEIVDPVANYATLMQRLFDFERIRKLFGSGFRLRFDAMNAVNGPYAKTILEDLLGAQSGTVVNARPLEDFGGVHPDPNPVHAGALIAALAAPGGPDLGAATDGDGDRHMIVARSGPITPSDSIAVLAANAGSVPGYAGRVNGVARSMPTSRALDRVAAELGIPLHETPTGWKFFGNLLDAGKIVLCGEESAGAGSDHLREKDGLWAVLFWLDVIAARGEGADAILRAHWRRYGRDYCRRLDFEAIPEDRARDLIEGLRRKIGALAGARTAAGTVARADEFGYVDPVDGSASERQGLRVELEGGARIVYRLSGTGTEGATLRVYVERYEPPRGRLDLDATIALKDAIEAATALAEIEARIGRRAPDVMQ